MSRFRLVANSPVECILHLEATLNLEVKHSFIDEFDFKVADVPSNENIY